MNTYNIKLTDDLTIPVRAKSAEEAQRIIRAEMVKREASPLFDKVYFDYETGIFFCPMFLALPIISFS